jgi:hypothetical protein
MEEMTRQNKNTISEVSDPIIITSTENRQSTVTDRKPAPGSAYDQNFMNWMQNFQYDNIIPNVP